MSEDYHHALDRVEREHWWFQAVRRLISEILLDNVPPPARVLDVGCSTGHLLEALPDTYERKGLDFSEAAIAHARLTRPTIDFAIGSIEELPYQSASFDAVLAVDVISAVGVESDARAVAELRRVLRPNGTLIAQVAAYEWLRSGHDRSSGTARRYTLPHFEGLLRQAGFTPTHITYRVSSVFPLAVPWRLLRRKVEGTDVAPVSAALNRILAVAMAAEHAVVKRVRLPFGLSIFAVAKADGG